MTIIEKSVVKLSKGQVGKQARRNAAGALCFLAGAGIALADRASLPIESVEFGQLVACVEVEAEIVALPFESWGTDPYAYDGGSRLENTWYEAVDPPTGTSGYSQHVRVHQSKADDRTSMEFDGVSLAYNASDALHRYTQIGVANRVYDDKGNLVDDGWQLLEYDAWNRLITVRDKATGDERAHYEHDAFGRRVVRVEGNQTRKYLYFGPRLLSAQHLIDSVPGNPTGPVDLWRRYVYGIGLDETVAFYRAGRRFDTYQDALGSTSVLVNNPSGNVLERYDYDAFGSPEVTDGAGNPVTGAFGRPASVSDNELWFAGSRWDPESAHYHMRHRQYEPQAGRFVSRDPLGYQDGPNPYTYGFSDPVNWVDPFGLEANSGPAGRRASGAPQPTPPRPVPGPVDPPWYQGPADFGLGVVQGLSSVVVGTFDALVLSPVDAVGLAVSDSYSPISSYAAQASQQLASGKSPYLIGEQGAFGIAAAPLLAPWSAGWTFGEGINEGDWQKVGMGTGQLGGIVGLAKAGEVALRSKGVQPKASPKTEARPGGEPCVKSAAQYARLKEHLRQLEKYGTDGFRQLENGRFRYYGALKSPTRSGEMAGARRVREWDPTTGNKRTWFETHDHYGTTRSVRPETRGPKVHYLFDENGNYVGTR